MEGSATGASGQFSEVLLVLLLVGVAVWRWRKDLRFERLRTYGVPETAAHLLQFILVALILYCAGVTVLEIFRPRTVPMPFLLYLPIVASVFAVVIMAGQLLPRDALWHHDADGKRTRIKWGRFLKVISSPIAAALAPIGKVALDRVPEVLNGVM